MPTYDIQELLNFRDLEICSHRPEKLPPQLEWMGSAETLRQEPGARKHDDKNFCKDTLNNHNNETESQKRHVKERTVQTSASHETIILGPPRNQFASSSPQQTQRKHDKTEGQRRLETPLTRSFDNSDEGLRDDFLTPNRRRKNENIDDSEEWHTRHPRKSLGQDDKPKKKVGPTGQSWEKKPDKTADVGNWRNNTPVKDRMNERTTEKNSRNRTSKMDSKESSRKPKDPEWMESDIPEDTVAQANSADAYEKWKEEMKSKHTKQEDVFEPEESPVETSQDDSIDDFIGADKASAESSLFAVELRIKSSNAPLASSTQSRSLPIDSHKSHKPSRFLSKYIGDTTPPVDIETQPNRHETPQTNPSGIQNSHVAAPNENLNVLMQNQTPVSCQSHSPQNEGSQRLMSILTGGRPAEQDYFQENIRPQMRPTELDEYIHPQSYLSPPLHNEGTPRNGFFHSLLQPRTPSGFATDVSRAQVHNYESDRIQHTVERSLDRSPFPSPGFMPPPGLRGPEPFNRTHYSDIGPGMHPPVRSIHPSSPMSPPPGPLIQFGNYQQPLPPQYPPHQYMMPPPPQFRGNHPHYMNGPPIHPQIGNQVYRPGPIPPPGLEQYPLGMQNRR
ncbi:hypothetical protein NEOLI_000342 [Neolecta irregularis DAH-3]|uniref:Uncharacterized protein n=1 Tax=Neolecta irregularis (strain DAH-3) TaxID=1198029 RepID=A0A1U7LW28_NEOID|nr:hypothetical protein NEOLI_000342 [Neolecta irregularis DAH-3]|eukprot:OLL26711.1 hypothetical protein NEOLI_000342 [Neolecta irregularis DAH-3]